MSQTGSRAVREAVWRANQALGRSGLVTLSFGNVSGLDRDSGVLFIKPSGVAGNELGLEQVVGVALDDGRVVGGTLRPSSDTSTHLALYRSFPEIGGVAHTHSPAASSWAQACRPIPPYGTTHADHFHGPVPVTRRLDDEQVAGDYETETGAVIVEALGAAGLNAVEMPAVLVASHGPFTWGADAAEAVDNAIALEAVAAMAIQTLALDPNASPVSRPLLDRHYHRKHGATAYYGQRR